MTDEEINEIVNAIMESDECLEYLFGTRPELKLVKPDWLLLSEQNLQLRFALPFHDENRPFGTIFTMPTI